jgi:osmotically-inducible protein OsmY
MNMSRSRAIVAVLLAVVFSVSCARSVPTNGDADDLSITTRVKTAFVNDPLDGLQKIDVDTMRGVVMLSGQAPTKEAEQRAIEMAKKVRGVVEVKSTVKIGADLTIPRS